MKVCIIGGGKVGYYLAKTLLEHGHTPVVVEQDARLCAHIADSLDLHVTCGDGTFLNVLESAGAGQCGAVVAVTGRDETNLVCCQLAREVFHVKRTVARVNNPKNAAILKRLGVDIAVSATDNLSHLIEREVETAAIHQLLSLAGGSATIAEVNIPDDFRLAGQTLAQLPTPEGTVAVSITRGGQLIIPRGNTQVLPGDRVMFLAQNEAFHELVERWGLTLEK